MNQKNKNTTHPTSAGNSDRPKDSIRPDALSRDISHIDFLEYYWLKSELLAFCTQNKLPTSGSKSELTERISYYLQTGELLKPKTKKHKGVRDSEKGVITATTIVENYMNDVATRNFFLDYIGPYFKFTVPFHEHRKKLLKNGDKFTYGGLAQFWVDENHKKKSNPSYKQLITPSCEYNKFLQDFSNSERNTKNGAARDAWMRLRNIKGPKTYSHYKHLERQGVWKN